MFLWTYECVLTTCCLSATGAVAIDLMSSQATAIQYLRRFYLTNSPMTYHPKQIMMCALFLATKSDHWYVSIGNLARELEVAEEDIKAPEFLLMQGLRFTLDVRHPMRGLDGGIGEIKAMFEEGLLKTSKREREIAESKINQTAGRAQKLLRSAAQMTDAYFMYTPSHIWLAALFVSDRDLTTEYMVKKVEGFGDGGAFLREKLLSTVAACADLLSSYSSPEDDHMDKKEMRRIGKKLHLCQNPEKVDLVAVTKAKAAEKREGSEPGDAEKTLKKRKIEREKLERDGDVFGPELKSVG